MAGEHEARLANGHDEPATETTGIALPPVVHAPTAQYALSAEERAAISALPAGSALLIAHSGPNQGARFLLDQDITQAGRHPDVDVFLDDVTVSRKHAQFRRTAEGFVLVDSGSLNGTYVNQDRVDSVRLANGAEVQIGKFRLTFYVGSPQPSAATGD
ncbi:FHA domain-containing protein [Paeniglutamicibacter cryotolerans]|uniref:PSer/pThr/pTyr-binding forkhead associated (FHA) protein n=1 Tax=Paeniglutamicibacter cryotolerans TaxID=670079 RepID=A0A839QNT3_9MICC|nr:FHA domain-containing protein [Paeniglutamicibacter cryotolerans]MBB2996295.1 pSer/pThr/pTyr-binding forkhead associated (FHA) protein [Paeniglutamicibacter cryotolerans]